MSYLNHLQTIFLLCFGLVLSTFAAPATFGQEDPDAKPTITLDLDEILGVADEQDETLSRLVDKSTISDLEFLNSGDSPTSIDQLKAMQEHVSSLYQRVEPAVVSIQSGMGQGSGVVVTSDGYILTAAHVIAVPNRSSVITFPDGTKARARTLGLFRTLDAGLLKIYAMVPNRNSSDEEATAEDAADEDEDTDEDSDKDTEDDSDRDEETEDESDEDQEMPNDDEAESDQEEDSDKEDSDEEGSDEEGSDEEDSDEEDSDEEMLDDEEADSDKDTDSDDEEDDSDKEDEDSKEEKPKKRDPFAEQDDLPSFDYLEIGDSTGLNLGQWVIAVGHPGGLDSDRGIVLRVGRINKINDEADAAFFQTDCTLVGGDSGGPLIGMDGSVLGIHSRIGIGLRDNFHVPSNDFVNNWSAMLDPVVHDRDPMTFVRFRGETNVIDQIPRNSVTARSGLRASDRIIRIGDKDIYDKLQFDDAISDLKPYQKVEFEVVRKAKKKVFNVTIGEKQERERR